MRNQKPVLLILLVLLLVGGAVAGWFFVFNQDEPGRRGQVATGNGQADPEPAQPGPAGPIDRTSTQPDKPGPDQPPAKDPVTNPKPKVDTPQVDPPKIQVRPKIDTPAEEITGPDMTDWPVRKSEHVIKGKIVYKSDGRAAAGAAISAEFYANAMMSGEAKGGEALKPPAGAKVEGTATSDGMGEFTLRLTLTHKVPPGYDDPEQPAKDMAPEDDEEADKSGRSWRTWGGAENIIIVGRMAGYAPARSGSVWLREGAEQEVKLFLAIPAALSGRVVDALTRKGIEGATVQLYQADAGTDGWTTPRAVQCDKDGYFSVSDLGAGSYMYAASANGYTAENAWQTGRRVDLSKGGEQNLGDIPLLPSCGLTGLVVDAETGEPIAGASVGLEQPSQWGNFSSHGVTTNQEGRFEVQGIGTGVYTLRASAFNYAPTTIEKVAAEAGKSTDVGTIKLGHGFSFDGMVLDDKGKGLAGATVTLTERKKGNGWAFGNQGRALGTYVTESNGGFKATGLAECEATLEATAAGFARNSLDLDLAPGMAAVTIRLFPGATVKGRVFSADGTLAKGCSVTLLDHSDPMYNMYKQQPGTVGNMRWFGQNSISGATRDDGVFALNNVPPGTYLLVASPATGQGTALDDLKVGQGGEVDAGDLRLPGPGTLRVTVTEQGKPVAGLKVTLKNPGFGTDSGAKEYSAETDSLGIAEIADVPAGDQYVTTAQDKDQWDTEIFTKRRVSIRSGQTTEFKLELKPANTARVHGRLTLDNKAQFNEVYILGSGTKQGFFKNTKPDEAGFFDFTNVPFGGYILHARMGDKVISCTLSITVENTADLEVNKDFTGRVVSGTVTTPNNSAAERASVKVFLQRLNDGTPEAYSQWLKAENRCDADGKFLFDHVPAGQYRLSASLEGVGSSGQDVTVSGSDMPGIGLTLSNNSGTIRVVIKKLTGTPLATQNWGMVQVRDSTGATMNFENGVGYFLPVAGAQVDMPTIPAGTYTVVVVSSGCMPLEKAAVVVTTGNRTDCEVDLVAAAELHMTFTNTEVTQAMLDLASVKYFDALGAEIARPSSPFDAWSTPPQGEKPLLYSGRIGSTVKQIKVKVPGYAEVTVNIEWEAGKKIEREESMVAE